MKVIFFNHFHNGDIHLSRSIVRLVMDKVKSIHPDTTFGYSHRNNDKLLADIPDLSFIPNVVNGIHEHSATFRSGDLVYFNTWYAQEHFKFMNQHGITLDTLYLAFDSGCKKIWGFSLEEISKDPKVFYPSIDYSAFDIESVQTWLKNNPERKVFVSNGHALSGQSQNFNMTEIINRIAPKYPSTIFILSNQETTVTAPNIIYSTSIIKKSGFDLNENGYLSEHCDLIIGRSSGAFSFAMTQNNMFRPVKFLTFSTLTPKKPGQYWLDTLLQDKITFLASITNVDTGDTSTAQRLIEERL